MNAPDRIPIKSFVRSFAERHRNRPDKPFCFVLGAGASRSSEIPTGEELVRKWLGEFHEDESDLGLAVDRWATADVLRIPGFESARAAEFYSQLYKRRFPIAQDGFAYLEKLMEG